MAASSGTVHALMDVVLPDGLTVGLAGILPSTVTVDDCTFQCGISSQSIFQCMDTQICFHICFHCQSKDAKIKAVENRRYIQFSIGRRDLRDVCNTFFQWGICMEIPFQQILRFHGFPICFCDPIRLSLWSMAQTHPVHNPVYGPLTGNTDSLWLFQQQCLIHTAPSISIVTFILADDFFHSIRQLLISPWTVFVHKIFIEALSADTKHPAIK